MKIPSLLFLVVTVTVSAGAAQLPDQLIEALSAVIHQHYPDARIEVGDTEFTAKHGTMMFTLHAKSKTGEVYPRTYQEEGPNFNGFLLRVSLMEGGYQGAAVVPQTLKGPYFPTFIDAPAMEGNGHHYWVRFSFGNRMDQVAGRRLMPANVGRLF